MLNLQSTPPPAGVLPTTHIPPAPSDHAPPAHSQIVASEASTSSPLAPSTQPTPPTMPTFSTQQILTRLSSRGKQVVQGIMLYTNDRTGM
ncbi:hypothetical protein GOBAR_DD25291 [Gossypium barbadense]|nr:hypothetical protein GOBAR_DD25291 [Gossypium barbadense]